jgi:hypothetical protein
MIEKFLKEIKLAIKTGLKWMSIIFTSIVLILFSIGLINNQRPDLELFFMVIFSAGIGFPILVIIVGFIRWRWDYLVTNRNFNAFPFSQLDSLGFKKIIENEGSKTRFINEYYTGKINDFIIDCVVDTQNENKLLNFKYYVNIKPLNRTDFKKLEKEFRFQDGYIDFKWITKKYHYKNHRLKSVQDLEKELIDFGKMILKENIEPSDYAIH